MEMKKLEELKSEILKLTREYSNIAHASYNNKKNDNNFLPTNIPYAGRVFDADEVEAAVDSSLDFWLTLGKNGDEFEKKFAKFLNIKKSILVNSGSSANLLAIAALSSFKLEDRQVRYGDEVITVAAGFPTTVAPIIQQGFVPVFVDNDPVTLNVDIKQLEEAYNPGITKAVMMAHTLGNPFNLTEVKEFCDKYNLWLIEDNCDSLGSLYNNQFTGTFGDLSTQSFYPPHHLTLGEGGAVNIVGNSKLRVIAESFRDWGRDCWCPSGCDNTCGKRFDWKLGDLPEGYDHKFIYSHLGYNLKPLDIQAAIGIQQLKKLPQFIQARVDNWQIIRKGLDDLSEFFTFMLPTHATKWSDAGFEWDSSGNTTTPSWFGFMIRVNPDAPFTKFQLSRYLDEHKIGNRNLFGGNLTRQPAFINLKKERPNSFRVIGNLSGADQIMNEAIFIGTYPGLSPKMLEFIIDKIHEFVKKY
jgi:CDP-4-dehydro-6-deoxyglucose reductase, E1